eukprot:gnl/MRDRNA2_/MRDRNA2_387446_c0_seq1.p1 gnl/MRDRNA2_/MRDRNA2_387446_c0~~gnl/MRDRNA2_/MRDRNA2_387446_c0_seq1.p1  ORF type:complete len:124 (+),score=16.32 gnl/MRDRNA2_/MRDRNA2_387446_c0_seq1:51-422(+)
MPLLKENIVRNNLEDVAQASPLLWGSQNVDHFLIDHVDTVIISDCIYSMSSLEDLISTIEGIAPREVILANKLNNGWAAFRNMTDHWTWTEISPPAGTWSSVSGSYSPKRVGVFAAKPRPRFV